MDRTLIFRQSSGTLDIRGVHTFQLKMQDRSFRIPNRQRKIIQENRVPVLRALRKKTKPDRVVTAATIAETTNESIWKRNISKSQKGRTSLNRTVRQLQLRDLFLGFPFWWKKSRKFRSWKRRQTIAKPTRSKTEPTCVNWDPTF